MSAMFFAAVIAVTALGPLTVHLALPAFPDIQRDFGAPLSVVQLAISASMFTMALATLAYGPLSDRFGRRPVLIVGLALFVAGSAICMTAPSITVLILGRLVQAAGAGCGTVIARAMLADVYSRERLAGIIGYITAAYVAAPALAVPLGGALITVFDWRAVFVAAFVLGAVILACAIFLLEETNRRPVPAFGLGQLLRGNAAVLRLPSFAVYALQLGFGGASFFGFIAAAPYLVIDLQSRTPAEYGIYFLLIPAGYLIGSLICGRLGGRYRAHQMVLAGSTFATTCTVAMLIWAWIDPASSVALFLCIGLMTLGGGIASPHAQAAGISGAGNLAGTASGMLVFAQWAFGAFAAQIMGFVANGTPYPSLALVVMFSLIGTVFAAVAARNAPRQRAVARQGP